MNSDDRRDELDPIRIEPEDLEAASGPQAASGRTPPAPSAVADERCVVRSATTMDRDQHCPYAGVNFEPGERVAVCRRCNAVHLEQSWIENRGCATYGCANAPDFRKDALVIETGAAPMPPPPPTNLEASGPPRAPVPLAALSGSVPHTGIVGPILVTVFCCQLTGVISLVYTLKANTLRLEARWPEARSARTAALVWMWVSVAFFPLGLLMIAAEGM